jgi:class 3 adenylate cyclase/streptogramin lyase
MRADGPRCVLDKVGRAAYAYCMPELPAGTVTFLFTDIEGSTRLLRQLGDRYAAVLAQHRRILREAAEARQGHEVDTQGDSFFFAFARANSALGAAVVAQRALAAHDWPDGAVVRVRMGLHTAEPEVGDERYVGLGVHRAARIGAVAHGGQVLLSSATRELVDDKVGDVAVCELGSYRLKDFNQPERLYQLEIEGLRSEFPPLRAEAVAPSRRRRLLLAAVAAVVACVTALAIVVLTRSDSDVALGPHSLAIIDPKTGKLVDAVNLGFKSNLIAAGEGAIWVVDPDGSTVWRIDPRTHETRSIGISVGAGAVPFGVAAGYGAIWVAVLRGSAPVVLQLGPNVGDLRRTVPYGGRGASPVLVYMHPLALGAGAVWAIDPARGGIWRIGPHAGPARKLVEGLGPLAIAAGSDAVWVTQPFGLTKVDAVTGNELGTLSASQGASETASVALGMNAVWFASSSGPTLSKVDPQSVSTSQTFRVGRGTGSIAVGETAIWVANSVDGTISRIDPNSGEERVVELGQTPGGVVAAYGAVWTSPGNARS